MQHQPHGYADRLTAASQPPVARSVPRRPSTSFMGRPAGSFGIAALICSGWKAPCIVCEWEPASVASLASVSQFPPRGIVPLSINVRQTIYRQCSEIPRQRLAAALTKWETNSTHSPSAERCVPSPLLCAKTLRKYGDCACSIQQLSRPAPTVHGA
eukprot:COSAG02_NODE_251_length_27002_cov_13.799242_7_plen_156_part_00